MPKPLPEQPPPPPPPTNLISNSILTQHLTSAKTEQNVEKVVQKSVAPPLKLKISLPPKPPKVKLAKKRIPKIPILPPKPPILGAFVPKKSISTKGKAIHELREKKVVAPKVPKLVIKTKQLKRKKKIQSSDTIKPCKVALKTLKLPLTVPASSPPPIKLNIKPIFQQEPLVKKLVIKDIKPIEKSAEQVDAEPVVNGEHKIPVIKLNIKDIVEPVVEERKVEKLTIRKPSKRRPSTDFKEEIPKKVVIKDVLPPVKPAQPEPICIKRLNIKEISKDHEQPPLVKPLNIKLPKPALKLSLKNIKSPPIMPASFDDNSVPSLKIKLPSPAARPKHKRGLMTILDGLTKNLPQPPQPEPQVNSPKALNEL